MKEFNFSDLNESIKRVLNELEDLKNTNEVLQDIVKRSLNEEELLQNGIFSKEDKRRIEDSD